MVVLKLQTTISFIITVLLSDDYFLLELIDYSVYKIVKKPIITPWSQS